jgi:hypothetical protein
VPIVDRLARDQHHRRSTDRVDRPWTESCIGSWIPSLGSSTKIGSRLGQTAKIIQTVLGRYRPSPDLCIQPSGLPSGIRNCYNEINGVDRTLFPQKKSATHVSGHRRLEPLMLNSHVAPSKPNSGGSVPFFRAEAERLSLNVSLQDHIAARKLCRRPDRLTRITAGCMIHLGKISGFGG